MTATALIRSFACGYRARMFPASSTTEGAAVITGVGGGIGRALTERLPGRAGTYSVCRAT